MASSASTCLHVSAPSGQVSGRAAGAAVAVVLIASFMDLLDATIVSIAAPAISADLGASESALQWTVAGYTLAIGAGLVTGGRIGDQLGRRRTFLAGLPRSGSPLPRLPSLRPPRSSSLQGFCKAWPLDS